LAFPDADVSHKSIKEVKQMVIITERKGQSLILFLLISIIFLSCSNYVDIEKEKQALMNADIEFSKLSEEKGTNEAFFTCLAKDGVLLRPNSLPIEGIEAIKERLSKSPDDNFTLTWKPSSAEVSKSGDLGYTYGIYEFKTTNQNSIPLIAKGTYITVWKKQADGTWKVVLDTGNQGVGPEK
jgi:ketosteroid isomerase-like protein